MIKIHSPLAGLSYQCVFSLFLRCGEGHRGGKLWEADKKKRVFFTAIELAAFTQRLAANVFQARPLDRRLDRSGYPSVALEHHCSRLQFAYLKPIVGTQGGLLGFVKRGEERRGDGGGVRVRGGTKRRALVLCCREKQKKPKPT